MNDNEMNQTGDERKFRNKAFVEHLKKLGRDLATLEAIVDLAETIDAKEIIVSCKNHVTTNLSTIPEQ